MEIDTNMGNWEDNYNSYSNYLIAIISSFIGDRLPNRFGADWGGLDIWSVKGGCYEGDFIYLDDNYNIEYFSRTSNSEDGINDTDILTFNCEENIKELIPFLTTLTHNIKIIK